MDIKNLVEKIDKKVELFDESRYYEFTKDLVNEERELFENKFRDGFSLYLKWIICLCEEIRPKQVVELGAYKGLSTLMFLAGMPKDSKLISVDTDPSSWELVKEDKRLIKIVGDDSDIKIYPKEVDLSQTDIWFIDSNHTGKHLTKEINLYSKFWKRDTIILFDDVEYQEFPDYSLVWKNLPYKKMNLPYLHYTSFGISTGEKNE